MRLIITACLFLSVMGFALAVDDVPESLRKHEWTLRLGKTTLFNSANFPQAPEPYPEQVWHDVGRVVVKIPTSELEVRAMDSDGTLTPFVQKHLQSNEDIVQFYFSDRPAYRGLDELAPFPTKEQAEWAKGLPDRWLLPLLDGYEFATLPKGLIATWDQMDVGNTARVAASHTGVQHKVSGGTTTYVCWYDRQLSTDQVLLEIIGTANSYEGYKIKLEDERGGVVVVGKGSGTQDLTVAWPSGNFIVMMKLPHGMRNKEVPRYLERYPSTWTKRWELNLQELMVRELSEAILEMARHVDDPLEFLRYSFRIHPFDKAFNRARRASSPLGSFHEFHDSSIKAIHDDWIKAPADQIKVADYRDAMLAHRRELIVRLVAERDRMIKEGIEPKAK